jgi:hypothetical protein
MTIPQWLSQKIRIDEITYVFCISPTKCRSVGLLFSELAVIEAPICQSGVTPVSSLALEPDHNYTNHYDLFHPAPDVRNSEVTVEASKRKGSDQQFPMYTSYLHKHVCWK